MASSIIINKEEMSVSSSKDFVPSKGLTYICAVCDEPVIICNANWKLSVIVHTRESKHINSVGLQDVKQNLGVKQKLKRVPELENGTGTTFKALPQNHMPNDNLALQKSRDRWIHYSTDQMSICKLCHVQVPNECIESHLQGRKHQQKITMNLPKRKDKIHANIKESAGHDNVSKRKETAKRDEINRMWKEVAIAEKGNFKTIQPKEEGRFICKLCDKKITSSFDVIQHVKGKGHQSLLSLKNSVKTVQVPADKVDTNALQKIQSDAKEILRMWQEISSAEGGYYTHIQRIKGKEMIYECTICNVQVGTCAVVLEHVHGKNHQKVLEIVKQIKSDTKNQSGPFKDIHQIEGEKMYECTLCNVQVGSCLSVAQHIIHGQNHQKKLNLQGIKNNLLLVQIAQLKPDLLDIHSGREIPNKSKKVEEKTTQNDLTGMKSVKTLPQMSKEAENGSNNMLKDLDYDEILQLKKKVEEIEKGGFNNIQQIKGKQLKCILCNAKVTFGNVISHIQGKTHQSKVLQTKHMQHDQKAVATAATKEKSAVPDPAAISDMWKEVEIAEKGVLCNIWCVGENKYRCTLCSAQLESCKIVVVHVRGNNHQKNLQRNKETKEVQSNACEYNFANELWELLKM